MLNPAGEATQQAGGRVPGRQVPDQGSEKGSVSGMVAPPEALTAFTIISISAKK
jgi:hypothetical protein